MKNGLKFYVKKNTQIVCNDNEELTEVLCKNVKKNMQIFWNDNEEWAEFLCKKEHSDCLE